MKRHAWMRLVVLVLVLMFAADLRAQVPVQLRWEGGTPDTATQATQSPCTWLTKIGPASVTAHTGWVGRDWLYGLGWQPLAWTPRQRLFVGLDAIEYPMVWRIDHFEFVKPADAPWWYPERFPAGTLRIGGSRNGDGDYAVPGCPTIAARGGLLMGTISYRPYPDHFGAVATQTYEQRTQGPYWFGACYVGGQSPQWTTHWGYPLGMFGHSRLPQSWAYSYTPIEPAATRDGAGVWLIGFPSQFRIADFNRDARATVEDVFAFLDCFFWGDRAADVDNSGAVTQQDVFDFLGAWLSS